ncbi:hypothetical protein GQ44DRAFT_725232 [Phaeosphaeriaceae sp. PMI808]|nr:hypothetical protein GQ44DRAFT_725232 [Phaeosphaeriaceae sp. PMI808]
MAVNLGGSSAVIEPARGRRVNRFFLVLSLLPAQISSCRDESKASARVSRAALLSPPLTLPPRRQSPLFEPELATQTAAAAQAYDLVEVEDEDTNEGEAGDPLLELEEELEEELEAPIVAGEGRSGEGYRALQGTQIASNR